MKKRLRKNPNKKPLLILDIDETLVFIETYQYFQDNLKNTKIDFTLDFGMEQMVGSNRPYLLDFLKYFNKYFDLAIWSKGPHYYVLNIVNSIIPKSISLKFLYTRNHLIKDKKDVNLIIKNFGYNKEYIFILDDILEYWNNYIPDNFWLIDPYTGSMNDKELKNLILKFEFESGNYN